MSAPIRLIVGLGNPGRDYAETRHNVGFMVLARLADRLGATWKTDKARKGELAAAPGVLLVRPQTFMNLSGECVGPLMRYYKYEPEQVLIIYDDIAFPTGTLKLRTSGSAGGHNGVKSLIAHLGSERFPRIRVGIGLPGQKNMVGHVLGKLSPEERPAFESALDCAVDAALCALREGFDAAANRYNTKKTSPSPPCRSASPTRHSHGLTGGAPSVILNTVHTMSDTTTIHTLSVLVENKFGVLSRVAGLFSGRGYNIHSLNVAPCEDPRFSRMNIDVAEQGSKLDQVIKQLSKLINVVEVIDYRNEPTIYREIVLLRVRFGEKKQEILELCNIFGARTLDATRKTLTIEVSGGQFRIARFLNLMEDYDVEMVIRSGKIAVIKPKE